MCEPIILQFTDGSANILPSEFICNSPVISSYQSHEEMNQSSILLNTDVETWEIFSAMFTKAPFMISKAKDIQSSKMGIWYLSDYLGMEPEFQDVVNDCLVDSEGYYTYYKHSEVIEEVLHRIHLSEMLTNTNYDVMNSQYEELFRLVKSYKEVNTIKDFFELYLKGNKEFIRSRLIISDFLMMYSFLGERLKKERYFNSLYREIGDPIKLIHFTKRLKMASRGWNWSDNINELPEGVVFCGGMFYTCLSDREWSEVDDSEDLDFYIYSEDIRDRYRILNKALDFFTKRDNVVIYNNEDVTSIYGTGRVVQLIMTDAPTAEAVVSRFDMDFVKGFFDGYNIRISEYTDIALNLNTVRIQKVKRLQRIFKYLRYDFEQLDGGFIEALQKCIADPSISLYEQIDGFDSILNDVKTLKDRKSAYIDIKGLCFRGKDINTEIRLLPDMSGEKRLLAVSSILFEHFDTEFIYKKRGLAVFTHVGYCKHKNSPYQSHSDCELYPIDHELYLDVDLLKSVKYGTMQLALLYEHNRAASFGDYDDLGRLGFSNLITEELYRFDFMKEGEGDSEFLTALKIDNIEATHLRNGKGEFERRIEYPSPLRIILRDVEVLNDDLCTIDLSGSSYALNTLSRIHDIFNRALLLAPEILEMKAYKTVAYLLGDQDIEVNSGVAGLEIPIKPLFKREGFKFTYKKDNIDIDDLKTHTLVINKWIVNIKSHNNQEDSFKPYIECDSFVV